MITRVLLFACLLPLSALAQLQVFEVTGTTETAVGALLNVGTASPGDTLVTHLRVRNIGSGPVSLSQLSISGEGFTIASAPSLPYVLSPYAGPSSEADIDIDFAPATITGSFSAFLAVNSLSIVLEGTSVESVGVTLAGSTASLAAGSVVNFGSVAVGASQTQGFLLVNSGSSSITVATVTVSGTGFSGPTGLTLPAQIPAGQSVPFQVKFTPQAGTPYQGTLTVDNRTFGLTGQGLDQPLPSASIVFASTIGASAQQNSVSITLASASQVSGNGTLVLTFQPSVAGVTDDAAIQFLSGPLRKATVSIAVGDTTATIGGMSSMPFQTGTTAGTITFTLTLPNSTPTASLTIPPAPISIDTATAVALLGSVNVAFSGFDNTYSASELAFTFYDLKGKPLSQGVIDVNATTTFQQYFSTTQYGGSFQLLAEFPVAGDTSQIGSVTAQITNSLATTTATQIPVGASPTAPVAPLFFKDAAIERR